MQGAGGTDKIGVGHRRSPFQGQVGGRPPERYRASGAYVVVCVAGLSGPNVESVSGLSLGAALRRTNPMVAVAGGEGKRECFQLTEYKEVLSMGEDRGPVARTDFKSDGTRRTRSVGSTPTLVRHFFKK